MCEEESDVLSDVNLSIFTTNISQFTDNHLWIDLLSTPLIILPEKLSYYGQDYPTRLVIFENGIKVDFAFFDIALLKCLVETKKLPPEYNAGYQVLIDKDKMTVSMSKAQGCSSLVESPNEKQFLSLIEEFWFEAYHVAKYAKREDLWPLKFRQHWITDRLLLKMVEWNAQAKREWRFSPKPHGKDMLSWVDKDIWEGFSGCFAGFDAQESYKALMELVRLFRRLAKETAVMLGYGYPEELDRKISVVIDSL